MDRSIVKRISAVLAAALLIPMLLCFAGCGKKTLIMTSVSPDETSRVEIYQVGDADFPFGDADCNIILTDGSKEIGHYSIAVANDGKNLAPENFYVEWLDDCADVTVMGEEMDPMICRLFYDGTGSSVPAE